MKRLRAFSWFIFLILSFLQAQTEVGLKIFQLAAEAHRYEYIGKSPSPEDCERCLQIYQELLTLAQQLPEKDISREALIIGSYRKMGEVCGLMGRFADALEHFKRGLQRLEQPKNPSKSLMALFYDRIGFTLMDLGSLPEALEYSHKALELRKKLYKFPHTDIAESHENIADIFYRMNDYPKAKESLEEAWKHRNKLHKPPHEEFAICYLLQCQILYAQGHYQQAMEEWQKGFDQAVQTCKPPHVLLVKFYTIMPCILNSVGRYQESLEYCQKALDQALKLYKTNPIISDIYNNMGGTLEHLGRYEESEQYFNKAIEQLEQLYKSPHPRIALAYHNRAYTISGPHKHSLVILYHQKALRDFTALYKSPHETIATGFMSLGYDFHVQGAIETSEGKHDEARVSQEKAVDFYKQGLAQLLQLYSPSHPRIALVHNNMAYALYQLEQFPKAWESLYTSFEIAQNLFQRELPLLSTEEKIERVSAHFRPDLFLTLCDLTPKEEWISSSFSSAIYSKDLVTRILTQEQKISQLTKSQGMNDLYAQYQEHVKSLNHLSYKLSLTEEEKQILQKLNEKKKQLERDISTQSSKFAENLQLPTISAADIQKVLPPQSALLEFVSFWHMKHNKQWMGLFILTKEKPILFISLGPQEQIKSLVSQISSKIAGDARQFIQIMKRREDAVPFLVSQESKLMEITTKLRELIWPSQVRDALRGVSTIFLAPDDCLHFLSFGMLSSQKGTGKKYFIEEYNFRYLPTGASLLKKERAEGKDFYGVGNPLYNLSPQDKESIGKERGIARLTPADSKVGDKKIETKRKWRSLPGGSSELQSAANWYSMRYPKDKKVLRQQRDALETLFLSEAPGKRWIHIATHGFFEDTEKDTTILPLMPEKPAGSKVGAKLNPLLLSGLVFSGANTPLGEKDDGYVTAADIALLNLKGTECVVLSCCETGLGKHLSGVGVFSFKWAFEYTGARHIVVSLWKVPDEETVVVMNNFYSFYSRQMNVGEALLESQRKYLEKQQKTGKAHPYFWAAFICQGSGT